MTYSITGRGSNELRAAISENRVMPGDTVRKWFTRYTIKTTEQNDPFLLINYDGGGGILSIEKGIGNGRWKVSL